MEKMGKCLIISGGHLETGSLQFYQDKIGKVDYTICADGGVRHAAKLGIKPDLVVGDFDTLTPEEVERTCKNGVKIRRYPCRKDYTDTHIALLQAVEMGYCEIDIIAAWGGRLDHTLANIMLLALPEAENARLRILDEKHEAYLVRNKAKFSGKTGEIISLLPLSDCVSGVFTKGLEYNLENGILKMGIPIGVSNSFADSEVEIEIKKGLLLAIRVLEEC